MESAMVARRGHGESFVSFSDRDMDFLCWDIHLFLSETVSFSPRDLPPTGSARSFFVVPVAFFCPRSRSLGITPSTVPSYSFFLCFVRRARRDQVRAT